MSKKIISFLMVLILMFSLSITVFAAPSDSYTHVDSINGKTNLQFSREMYTAVKRINSTTLGLNESLDGLTDICTDSDGYLYVLCGNNSKLYKVANDFSSATEIVVVDENNNNVNFKGAKGIYCDNGMIFIADTAHAKILICDSLGKIVDTLTLPESKLVGDDFLYQPTSIIRDEHGYTYVLSLGCYYGALLYSPEYEFLGFYGSNSVEANALDTLAYLWDRLTSTDKKKEATNKKLPYSFVDFCFDSEGYMITCTGSTSANDNGKGQIKKISPNGMDILYKRNLKGGSDVSSTINFLENELVLREERTGNPIRQNMICVTCSDDDYIFALDKTHGCIYIYDWECNLMSAFGGGYGVGEQLGAFISPVSMCFKGDSVLVADAETYSITIFEPTEYGKMFREAESLYLKGNYSEAAPIWSKILEMDASNQLAHRGLAMVYFNNGDYKAAMESAKISYDYTVYDLAYSAVVSEWFANNFIWLILILVILITAIIIFAVNIKKGRIKFSVSEKVKIMLGVSFHPFRNFEDIKYRKKGSVKLAILITVLLYVAFSLKETCSGFLYSNTDTANYYTWYTLIGTSGLLILWSICNWLVSSMFQGKGTFKEVYITSAYAMVPMICYTLLYTVFSNLLPLSLVGLLVGIGTAITIFTIFLMIIAMMIVHEIDFFKFILMLIVTLFFMILVIFVILMCSILMMQFVTFFKSILQEIAFR